MSANTRRQQEQGRLLSLSASAHDLIGGDKRTHEDTANALNALQYFKEGIPFVCLPLKPQRGKQRVPEEFHQLLSTPLSELPLEEEARVYCMDRGAFYLGEVYLIRFDRPSTPRDMIERFLFRIDLPLSCDPFGWEWIPPYWSHMDFRKLLSTPLDRAYPLDQETSGSKWWFERHWRGGRYYVGQVLRHIQTQGIGPLAVAQKCFRVQFRRAQFALLPHACMYVPGDWHAPQETPKFVLEWSAAQKRQRAEWEHRMNEPTADEAAGIVREEHREALEQSIDHLSLSAASMNGLRQLGFKTIEELVRVTEQELLKRAGQVQPRLTFGRKCVCQIRETLAGMGFRLGMKFPDNWNQQQG